jgi:hypothetical protein
LQTAGELLDQALRSLSDADVFQQLGNPLFSQGARHAEVATVKIKVMLNTEVAVKIDGLGTSPK